MAVHGIVVAALAVFAALLCSAVLSFGALEARAGVPEATSSQFSAFGGPTAISHPRAPKAIWRESAGRSQFALRRVACRGLQTQGSAGSCFAAVRLPGTPR
jgi:hypothetical protein